MKYLVIERYINFKDIETVFSNEDLLRSKTEAELFFAAKRKGLNSVGELSGKVELGIISESGEYYSLSGRSQLSAAIEAIELLKYAESDFIDTSQKKKIQAIVKKNFKF